MSGSRLGIACQQREKRRDWREKIEKKKGFIELLCDEWRWRMERQDSLQQTILYPLTQTTLGCIRQRCCLIWKRKIPSLKPLVQTTKNGKIQHPRTVCRAIGANKRVEVAGQSGGLHHIRTRSPYSECHYSWVKDKVANEEVTIHCRKSESFLGWNPSHNRKLVDPLTLSSNLSLYFIFIEPLPILINVHFQTNTRKYQQVMTHCIIETTNWLLKIDSSSSTGHCLGVSFSVMLPLVTGST